RYPHGHHESVLRSHRWRTAANSAAYLVPHLRPGMSLLDVGCGPATLTAELAALVAPGRVTAVEASPHALEVAAAELAGRSVPNVELVLADAHTLGFADGSFDVVHAHQLLQHLADPVGALAEMRRVCRPGGIVAARDCDYAAFTWYPQLPELAEWLALDRRNARAGGGEPDGGRRLAARARGAGGCCPGHGRPASPGSRRAPPSGASPRPRTAPGGAACGRTGWWTPSWPGWHSRPARPRPTCTGWRPAGGPGRQPRTVGCPCCT